MLQGFAQEFVKLVILIATLIVLVPTFTGFTVVPVTKKDKMTWLGALLLCLFPPLVLWLLPFVSLSVTGANNTGEAFLQRVILYLAGAALLSRRKTCLNLSGVPAVLTVALVLGAADYFVSKNLQIPNLPFLH